MTIDKLLETLRAEQARIDTLIKNLAPYGSTPQKMEKAWKANGKAANSKTASGKMTNGKIGMTAEVGKKLHWTQTSAGRRRMRKSMKARYAAGWRPGNGK